MKAWQDAVIEYSNKKTFLTERWYPRWVRPKDCCNNNSVTDIIKMTEFSSNKDNVIVQAMMSIKRVGIQRRHNFHELRFYYMADSFYSTGYIPTYNHMCYAIRAIDRDFNFTEEE